MPTKCIGTLKCLTCSNENPVKENDKGALNLSCGYCDLSAYAKKGTQAERIARERLKPLPGAEQPPAPPSAPPPPPAPQKKSSLPWGSR